RHGRLVRRAVSSDKPEMLLLVVLGLRLLVAGAAQHPQLSAAVRAFLAGVALSHDDAGWSRNVLSPLPDLFPAVNCIISGLHTAPSNIPPVLVPALALDVVTVLTKIATGYWAARRAGVSVA